MALIACSRMYNATPAVRDAWAALFARVSDDAGVPLDIVDHAAPAPLDDLWRRPDIGSVFMCGWPFSQAAPQPRIVVAPVPAGDRYGGKPVYFTDLVARRDRGFTRLEDTFGGRIAWTVENSHSGFNAPRYHLLRYRQTYGARLYRERVGPVLTPAGALDSVITGQADVAPMDSYALDLMRRHAPATVRDIAVLASTAAAPVPPLVARHDVDAETLERLRNAFLDAGSAPETAALLDTLGLVGFAPAAPADYALAARWEREALARGYPHPG